MSLDTLSSRLPSFPMPMIQNAQAWPLASSGIPCWASNSVHTASQATSSANSAKLVMDRHTAIMSA
jgi:hypothetical protein